MGMAQPVISATWEAEARSLTWAQESETSLNIILRSSLNNTDKNDSRGKLDAYFTT